MRFKDLRSSLKEANGGHGAYDIGHLHPAVGPMNPDGAVDTPETNISSLTDSSLTRLNAFLGAAFSRSYISTGNVLTQIRIKLSEVGLHFDHRLPPPKVGNGGEEALKSDAHIRGPINELDAGVYEFPLSYLGGSYGRYPTDPGYDPYYSDGIANKIGTPLVLTVEISVNENSTFSIKPYIKVAE
jgi:hypothetical protein